MSLPPLPGSLAVFTPTRDQHVKLNWIVRKYGALCRKEALEKIAHPSYCGITSHEAANALKQIKELS